MARCLRHLRTIHCQAPQAQFSLSRAHLTFLCLPSLSSPPKALRIQPLYTKKPRFFIRRVSIDHQSMICSAIWLCAQYMYLIGANRSCCTYWVISDDGFTPNSDDFVSAWWGKNAVQCWLQHFVVCPSFAIYYHFKPPFPPQLGFPHSLLDTVIQLLPWWRFSRVLPELLSTKVTSRALVGISTITTTRLTKQEAKEGKSIEGCQTSLRCVCL